MDDKIPCCAAEALRRIRQIPVNGIMTGITMLDESIADVKARNLTSDQEIRAALMKKIRVYNYVPPGVAEAYAQAIIEEYGKTTAKKLNNFGETMKKIEIIGTGCAKCKRLLANAEQAVKELNIAAEVLKVDDIDEIVDRGVMMTPALFINGQVRAEGRVPDVNEIRKMLSE